MLRLLRQGCGDLLLHLLVVREEAFKPAPHLERLLVAMRALINASQRLEDLQKVGRVRLAADGALERLGRRIGLTDKDQRLAQVIGCQRLPRQAGLRLAKCVHRGGVSAALASTRPSTIHAGPSFGSFPTRSR